MDGQNEIVLYISKKVTGSRAFEDANRLANSKININGLHKKILSICSHDYRIYTHHVRQYCWGFHLISQGNKVWTILRMGR